MKKIIDIFKKPTFSYILAGIILLGAGIYLVVENTHTPAYTFASVKQGDITQTVQVNGNVDAAKNIPLVFLKGGTITEVDAKVGDNVKQGQVIAKTDTKDANAAIAAAQASVQAAQAIYNKVLNGATNPQIDQAKAAVESAKVALDNAKQNVGIVTSQQQTLVANAQSTMLNAGLAATPSSANISSSPVTVTGTYTGANQGSYNIVIYATGSGMSYQYSGLETGSGIITQAVPLSLGKDGLFINFASTSSIHSNDSWTINIPNTQSATYLQAYNAYQNALQTQDQALATIQQVVNSAQAAYDQANAQLETVITPARSEDVAAAQAQINAANAQLEAAQNVYDDGIITAPFDGQIGSLDLKAGSTVASAQSIGTLITNNQYEIDVNLSQAEISKVKVGDTAQATFDAYPGQEFAMTLASVDSNSTNVNGVDIYKAVLVFVQNDSRIKSGLSSNLIISDVNHKNTLIVPASAIITKDNSKYVMVKDSNGKLVQKEVTLGIENSDSVEVLSGLQANDQVATF